MNVYCTSVIALNGVLIMPESLHTVEGLSVPKPSQPFARPIREESLMGVCMLGGDLPTCVGVELVASKLLRSANPPLIEDVTCKEVLDSGLGGEQSSWIPAIDHPLTRTPGGEAAEKYALAPPSCGEASSFHLSKVTEPSIGLTICSFSGRKKEWVRCFVRLSSVDWGLFFDSNGEEEFLGVNDR